MPGLRSFLGVRRRSEVIVESEVLAGQHLGGEDDLPRVLGKMLHHVVDSVQDRKIVFLNGDALNQPVRTDSRENVLGVLNRLVKALRQLLLGHTALGGELLITHARIGCAADSGNNPLPHVAAQVEHQISDGVFALRAPRPDLVLVETLQTLLNARSQLLELALGVLDE
jgi:hypothetical protein